MKRRSLRVLLGTGLGLLLVPVFNLLVAPPSSEVNCCSPERLFNMDFLLRGVSLGLYRVGISVDPSQAVIGRSDWVFLGDRYDTSVTSHRATGSKGDVQQGAAYAQGAQRWDAYLRAKGVRSFQIMVAPNKESIYPDHLPDWAAPGQPGVTDALFEGTGERLFHDLRQPLRAARQGETVPQFYRYDTHWNTWGASHAFRAFSERLGRELPDLKWPADAHHRLLRVDRRAGGDLADFLRLGASVSDDEPILDFGGLPYDLVQTRYGLDERVNPDHAADSRVALSHPLQTRNAGALNTNRVLWLTDSFGGQMGTLMHASFSDVVRVHWRDALRNGGTLVRLVDEWKPDLVFVTVVEHSFRGPMFGSFLGYAPVAVPAPGEQDGPAVAFEVSGMRGLVRESPDRFRVSSESPSLSLSVPVALDLGAPLSLALTCLDGAVALPVQLFWKSADEARFHRDRSMRFLHIGERTPVDIRNPLTQQRPAQVKDVRLDFWGQGFCTHFRLGGLTHLPADEGRGTGRVLQPSGTGPKR